MITGASKAIKHHHPNAIIIRIDPVSVDGVSRVDESDTWWLRAWPSSWAKSGSLGPPFHIWGNQS